MWTNGVSLGAVLRIRASSAATSLLRGSSSWPRYSAGVDALSWPFIFSTAYHGRRPPSHGAALTGRAGGTGCRRILRGAVTDAATTGLVRRVGLLSCCIGSGVGGVEEFCPRGCRPVLCLPTADSRSLPNGGIHRRAYQTLLLSCVCPFPAPADGQAGQHHATDIGSHGHKNFAN